MDKLNAPALTQEQLEHALGEWKRILRLQDWDVIAVIRRGNGLDIPADSMGRCRWT